MLMMEKDLTVLGDQRQIQLLPELDQNLRPNYLIQVRLARNSYLVIHVNQCHNDMKLKLLLKKRTKLLQCLRAFCM